MRRRVGLIATAGLVVAALAACGAGSSTPSTSAPADAATPVQVIPPPTSAPTLSTHYEKFYSPAVPARTALADPHVPTSAPVSDVKVAAQGSDGACRQLWYKVGGNAVLVELTSDSGTNPYYDDSAVTDEIVMVLPAVTTVGC